MCSSLLLTPQLVAVCVAEITCVIKVGTIKSTMFGPGLYREVEQLRKSQYTDELFQEIVSPEFGFPRIGRGECFLVHIPEKSYQRVKL